uniref:Ribosomal RNA-processing protein 40 n=1 Tax=Pyramimonas obovata TaxID=1411642 RepID=A0A7S0QLZ0_9CHLO|mmetsp:Transcript_10260/g.21409  ORF Transcript_10260/g.21409 Transcript_10260/m.21409 type:complete len:247 (+) Transcript_10260:166-906(+)
MGKSDKKPSLSPLLGQVVAPGDTVLELPKEGDQVVRIGGGLQQIGDVVVATRAGAVRNTAQGQYFIEGSQKRYIPQVDDAVIAVVTRRIGEMFEVDIGGPFRASLSGVAFEGATRRNRPNLKVGALVYGRVISADRDMEPEIECMDAHGKSSGFGPVAGGDMFNCTTGLARVLLGNPPCPVLVALGSALSYEIAVGINGRVWVKAEDAPTTILVSNSILNSEFISAKQSELMVKTLLTRMGKLPAA